jgi:hypothetical protein
MLSHAAASEPAEPDRGRAEILHVAAALARDAHLGVRVILPPTRTAAQFADDAAEEAAVDVSIKESTDHVTVRFAPPRDR